MCVWRGKRNWEERFPHQNWPIILGMMVIVEVAYSVVTPSIYQFITTPRSAPEELENEESSDKFWPGLGGSESLYAWAIVAYSIGETALSPVAGFTTTRFPYIFSHLGAIVLFIIGGVLYGLTTEVWIAIVARLFFGLAAGVGAVVVHTYLGEMTSKMDKIREKRGKRPRKYVLYISFSFVLNGTFVVSYGVSSIVAQFESVNPYRWPGWFVVTLALSYAAVSLVVFRDTRPPPKLKRPKGCLVSCNCLTSIKLMTQLQSNWKMQFIIYGYLTACGLLNGQLYTILATLITPVLSDQFGFSVKYTSYYLIGVALALLASTFFQLAMKVLRADNRVVLGAGLLFTLVGSTLMGDWQAVRHNPCSSNSSEIVGIDMDSVNNSSVLLLPPTGEQNSTSNSSLFQQLVENCEAQSSSSHQCYWNPKSSITGEVCITCHASCLSKQTTINFYQFTVGTLLIALATPLMYIFISVIASDVASAESQGTIMGLTVGAGALTRAISPLWLVETYEISDKHIYISAAVTALMSLLLLLGLVVLYKNLAPRRTTPTAQTGTRGATNKCLKEEWETVSYS